MKMKDTSSTALLVFAAVCLLLGLVILSPDGRIFSLVLAGIMTAVVLVFGGSRKKRIVALVILLAVIAQAIPTFRESRASSDAQRKRAAERLENRGSQQPSPAQPVR